MAFVLASRVRETCITLSTQSVTITQSTMASHAHSYRGQASAPNVTPGGSLPLNVGSVGASTSSTGGDGAHAHLINIQLQYVDLIICQKD
jgi:hypothetical protein